MSVKRKTFEVDTSPSKEVVVTGLTKDASVEACIFDLIDNSIDAARDTTHKNKRTPAGELPASYSGFTIKLTITGGLFKIEDNCGGISTADLKKMVLRFGRRSSHDMGIGVFGVGLNRALFKLGRVSHLRTDNGKERSELVLNTDEYVKDDLNWNLPAESFKTTGKIGTEIEITKIPDDITQQFADQNWIDTSRTEIGRRYGRFISKGLVITLNKIPAVDQETPLRENGPYEGDHKFYKTSDGVSIYIQYGEHRDHRFKGEAGYSLDENVRLTSQYGWTIYCNDRAITIADTSDKTGWDTKFHSEFYGFVGRVEFTCSDPAKLPWNTSKSDIDLNNSAYRLALKDMRKFNENWRSIATARKKGKKPSAIPSKIPPKATSAEAPAVPRRTHAALKASKPVTKLDHNDFREVIPQDVQELHCTDKLLALVHEAKRIDMGHTHYIGLALIRILFEVSVGHYLRRISKFELLQQHAIDIRRAEGVTIDPKEEKSVLPKMDEILKYLDKNTAIWGAKTPLKHSLKRMIYHAPNLNGAVHNMYQIIDRSSAFTIRNEVLPVLRHFIEAEA